jgi:transposase InsO family protein
MRFPFIDEHKKSWPVAVICDVMQVTRAGYYAWRKRPVSKRKKRREELIEQIGPIFTASRGTYGSPRVHKDLLAKGEKVDRKTVAKLMAEQGIYAAEPRSFVPTTTDSSHDLPVAANRLDRQFTATAPNQKWCADITYIWTDQGWMYLACVMDLFSRMIVGWSMGGSLGGELVRGALNMAITRRRPSGDLLHHSDRGCQYAAGVYRALLCKHGITPSMSRAGCCYDNAAMESFFATLKRELIHRTTFATAQQAQTAIFEYIEAFYNRQRRHSSLGYLSPQAFEAQIN